MEMKTSNWVAIGIGLIIILGSFLFANETRFMFFIMGFGVLIAVFPFIFNAIRETSISTEKEEMFLEFSRNLVESVKTGTSISKSIINVKEKPYGSLSKHIRKLANQISMGIPLNHAIKVFAKDVNNKTISRALMLIGQAERAGGDIGEILESVAGAVNTSDKLKKERKSRISALVVQGYIIFVIFLAIVLIMQFKILPMISGIAASGALGQLGGGSSEIITQETLSDPFLYLLLIQGFFSGLAIGKLAEGNVKSGIKHSFALMLLSFLVSAISSLFFT